MLLYIYVRAHQREHLCAEVEDGLNNHHNGCMQFSVGRVTKLF